MNDELKKYFKKHATMMAKARWNKIKKEERSEIMRRVRKGESNPQHIH